MLPGEDVKVENPQDPKQEEELVPKEDGSLEVPVTEETPEGDEPKVEEAPKPIFKAPERDDKDRRENATFYQIRKLQNEIEELKKSKIPSKEEKNTEDLEAELAKKPVSTIQEMIRQEARAMLDEERNRNSYVNQFEKTLEGSKSKVLKRHPELEDSSSVKSQVMLEILNNRPDLTNNPYGPVIAMTEMEEVLEQRGYKDTKPAVKVPLSSLPQSRVVPQTSKTVTLTKEDLEFCKEHNLNPKTYAQTRSRMSKNVSVEV